MGNTYWATVQNMFVADCSELGVNEMVSDQYLPVTVFPNPSDGKFSIVVQNQMNPFQLEVYTSTGKLIFVAETIKSGDEIDLSFLQAGMYFYFLSIDGQKINKGKLLIR